MAKESGNDEPAEVLREEIARSRELVSRSLSGLRYELDFPRKYGSRFNAKRLLGSLRQWPWEFSGPFGRHGEKKLMPILKMRRNQSPNFLKLDFCSVF